jgi:hypothetical protein
MLRKQLKTTNDGGLVPPSFAFLVRLLRIGGFR